MHFEIHQEGRVHLTSTRSGGGDWRWKLVDDDSSVIASGEGFQSKAACREAVEKLKRTEASTVVVHRL